MCKLTMGKSYIIILLLLAVVYKTAEGPICDDDPEVNGKPLLLSLST